MWAFLSRRFRTWLLLAVALPALRTILWRLTAAAQTRRPGTTGTKLLTRVRETVDGLATRSRTYQR